MKICVLNKSRELACDFVCCALLRDNVQHHIEAGAPARTFWCLHALADLIWSDERIFLPCGDLRHELGRAWMALEGKPYQSLAISIHTRAALQGFDEPPPIRGTILHSVTSWSLPLAKQKHGTLGDLFHAMVFELFIAALEPLEGGVVCARALLPRSVRASNELQ